MRGEYGPSGLADWPRPFVFRGGHLDGLTISAGRDFYFDLHLFVTDPMVAAYFMATISLMASAGFGPQHGRAKLVKVTSVHRQDTIWIIGSALGQPIAPEEVPLLCLNLESESKKCSRVRVNFLTPTELTSEGASISKPEFHALFGRLRDRISNLSQFYGGRPLDLDFRGLGERARNIHLTACNLRQIEAERTSSRTGQTHTVGGFVGTAEYAGDLGEFIPFLEAGYWIGVGKKTPWGNGQISVEAQ